MEQQTIALVSIAATQDHSLLTEWEKHLHPLVRAKHLACWSEHDLLSGEIRLQRIRNQLQQADVIVFLVSPDLFDSEECCKFIDLALTRQQITGVKVLPLLVRIDPSWFQRCCGRCETKAKPVYCSVMKCQRQ